MALINLLFVNTVKGLSIVITPHYFMLNGIISNLSMKTRKVFLSDLITLKIK